MNKKHVLIVEDSTTQAQYIKARIEMEELFAADTFATMKETEEYLRSLTSPQEKYLAALLDLNLPDAPKGEIVDLLSQYTIPSIVFTSEISDEVRESIWSKSVADYIIKGGASNLEYIISLLYQLVRNPDVKVMVVEDSPSSLAYIAGLLKVHNYNVLQAKDGSDALSLLKSNPDTMLVLTDYYMPEIDGFGLTLEIRKLYGKNRLAVIGMSDRGNYQLSAKFIKNGANDFINKPFIPEELYCRIAQNIDMIRHIREIEFLAWHDPLTGCHNRRYFFEQAPLLIKRALESPEESVTLAMIDIDHFKKINDTWGHDNGDRVLKEVASVLINRAGEGGIVARFGGEEFCVLKIGLEKNHVFAYFDSLRKLIASKKVDIDNNVVTATVSIGLTTYSGADLHTMLVESDECLYVAKKQGRNRVITAEN